MGGRLIKFEFIPGKNEMVEAKITLPEEPRSVLLGQVRDYRGHIVADAVVQLFEKCAHSLRPLSYTFTDEYGHFLFGPLCFDRSYVVKVWYDDVKIRPLTIFLDQYGEACRQSEEDADNTDDEYE